MFFSNVLIANSLQMCNYKVSMEMTLKNVLDYHKCLSLHSTGHLFQRQYMFRIYVHKEQYYVGLHKDRFTVSPTKNYYLIQLTYN